jgi:hypothetical protein
VAFDRIGLSAEQSRRVTLTQVRRVTLTVPARQSSRWSTWANVEGGHRGAAGVRRDVVPEPPAARRVTIH